MAISRLTTEDGNPIVQENVAGFTGASSLNDTHIESIYSETFTTNPLSNGWLIGASWSWSSGNGNMQ